MWHRGTLVAILAGGLTAGAFDILYAMLLATSRGNSITALLQFIASGLIGKSSFEAGLPAAALGLALHFLMALLIAAIYISVCRFRWARPLRDQPLLAGPLFGVLVCFVMREIVVPLSLAPIPAKGLGLSYADLGAMMFLVGLPIALAGWKFAESANGVVKKRVWG